MSPHSIAQPRALLAALALAAGAGTAMAQTGHAPATMPAPAPPAFRSALEGYQPYTEEKTGNWKEANDLTARIGGWRAYAREAQAPETADAPTTPTAPDPHAGHHMPAKDKP